MVKLRSPEFHDVYIERENLLYYQHHGDFPEGTALVKEIVLTQKDKYPDGSLDSASAEDISRANFMELM